MNANVKCFILCIYKIILKPRKQFLTVSNHKMFSLHALWMTILRPSKQLLTVSNHQVFRFYTLLKLSKVFHPSICSSFVLDLRKLLLRVSRWITNMLVLSKYLLTVYSTYNFTSGILFNDGTSVARATGTAFWVNIAVTLTKDLIALKTRGKCFPGNINQ